MTNNSISYKNTERVFDSRFLKPSKQLFQKKVVIAKGERRKAMGHSKVENNYGYTFKHE